jgi:hypothetical protein
MKFLIYPALLFLLLPSSLFARTPTLTTLKCQLALGNETEVPAALKSYVLFAARVKDLYTFSRAEGWRTDSGKAYLWASDVQRTAERDDILSHMDDADPRKRAHFIYSVDLKSGDVSLIHIGTNISAFRIIGGDLYVAECDPGNVDLLQKYPRLQARYNFTEPKESISEYQFPLGRMEAGRTLYRRTSAPWVVGRSGPVTYSDRITDFEFSGTGLVIKRATGTTEKTRVTHEE